MKSPAAPSREAMMVPRNTTRMLKIQTMRIERIMNSARSSRGFLVTKNCISTVNLIPACNCAGGVYGTCSGDSSGVEALSDGEEIGMCADKGA